jgi:hypothetical protein
MKTSDEKLPPHPSGAVASDIYPLDEFYAAVGEPLPEIHTVKPDEIPEPYHSLLVHKTDMTSTLETFHGETLHIEVLGRQIHGNEYRREVVLVLDKSRRRVEFGAIKINLSLFSNEAREEIQRAQQPLGRILNTFNIPFSSHPSVYLRIVGDGFISSALKVFKASYLYGRRNSLLNPQGRSLAEIVEILPP